MDATNDLLKEHHTLIGGTTGSGKSTFIQALMYKALELPPSRCQFVLIDLKRVELIDYAHAPHTLYYAQDITQALHALDVLINIMETRFQEMQAQRVKETNRAHIYIIIDELADLMSTAPKDVTARLNKIGRLGRASHIHLICCTQDPTRRTISASIQQNFTCCIALRCKSSIESRQVIGVSGAELLPRYGKGIRWDASGIYYVDIKLIPQQLINNRLKKWGAL